MAQKSKPAANSQPKDVKLELITQLKALDKSLNKESEFKKFLNRVGVRDLVDHIIRSFQERYPGRSYHDLAVPLERFSEWQIDRWCKSASSSPTVDREAIDKLTAMVPDGSRANSPPTERKIKPLPARRVPLAPAQQETSPEPNAMKEEGDEKTKEEISAITQQPLPALVGQQPLPTFTFGSILPAATPTPFLPSSFKSVVAPKPANAPSLFNITPRPLFKWNMPLIEKEPVDEQMTDAVPPPQEPAFVAAGDEGMAEGYESEGEAQTPIAVPRIAFSIPVLATAPVLMGHESEGNVITPTAVPHTLFSSPPHFNAHVLVGHEPEGSRQTPTAVPHTVSPSPAPATELPAPLLPAPTVTLEPPKSDNEPVPKPRMVPSPSPTHVSAPSEVGLLKAELLALKQEQSRQKPEQQQQNLAQAELVAELSSQVEKEKAAAAARVLEHEKSKSALVDENSALKHRLQQLEPSLAEELAAEKEKVVEMGQKVSALAGENAALRQREQQRQAVLAGALKKVRETRRLLRELREQLAATKQQLELAQAQRQEVLASAASTSTPAPQPDPVRAAARHQVKKLRDSAMNPRPSPTFSAFRTRKRDPGSQRAYRSNPDAEPKEGRLWTSSKAIEQIAAEFGWEDEEGDVWFDAVAEEVFFDAMEYQEGVLPPPTFLRHRRGLRLR
ncbi:hypothetical protein K458DRAFT_383261 [Lentithecium fluviatile CBS 122367]|uniref:Uncharacterized protein n=1 Tax=Lentithecium fluviatile CBS 122367 TaxID=1168545 RepID=A0A6G1JHT6_9PLEO|nr:hypothetical protein K458DRAFT_383261 [Lentithecium fluviatile CBS 122367]